MSESSRPNAISEATVDMSERVVLSNKHAFELMIGAQQIMLEELLFAGNEALERARTETHLLAEFASKLASVHSVRGIQAMVQECGRHQIDFLRRDSERVYKHGQRMIDAGVNLMGLRWRT
jgi:hypothetical protein